MRIASTAVKGVPTQLGHIALRVRDVGRAVTFYSDVVGWKTQLFEGGPMEYRMWVGSEGPLGGVMQLPEAAVKMGAPPHWTSNVTVDDVQNGA